MTFLLDIYNPALIERQLDPEPPAPIGRPDQSLLVVLMASAEYTAWKLGHDLQLERTDEREAVGWCLTCGWAASVDTRPGEGDDIFNGSAMSTPCTGERGATPPWASR